MDCILIKTWARTCVYSNVVRSLKNIIQDLKIEQGSNTGQILADLTREVLRGDHAASIRNYPRKFPTELIEKLSLATALKHWNGQINHRDGDGIMNTIYTFLITNKDYVKKYKFPDIFWECYAHLDLENI